MISQAFGISPSKFGLTNDVNRSTAEASETSSDLEAVRPIAELVRDAINEFIWNNGYTDIELRFVYDQSAQEIQQKALAARNLVEAEIFSRDEARAEWGLPPAEEEEQGRSTLYRYRKLIDKEFPSPKGEKTAPTLNQKSSGAGQNNDPSLKGGDVPV
jgi:hypothetical protein